MAFELENRKIEAEVTNPGPDNKVPMNTLTERVNKAIQNGYVENFKVTKQGLYVERTDKTYQPADVYIKDFYRFEGESDPADNAIMYVIETWDDLKGTLIDAYGAYSDANVTKFISEVQEINKKVDINKENKEEEK
ncbi:MAG: hypothetical protein K0Q79_475 [Flavipsychrobacter sp.]|jgi:hypothetical protein|nr:hypothetical protein [Flavipsychrobacter sp.]